MAIDQNGVYVIKTDGATTNPDGSITYKDGSGTFTTYPDGTSSSTQGGITTKHGPADPTTGYPGAKVSVTNDKTGQPATSGEVQAVNDNINSIDWKAQARMGLENVKTASEKANLVGMVTGKQAPGFDNNAINSQIDKTLGGTGTTFGGEPIPGTSGSGTGGGSLTDAVNHVADEAFGYANTNRDFQLAGLDKANAALGPAQQSYAGMYGPGGTLTGPGQGEQAYSQVGGKLLAPTAQSQALSAASPFLSGQSPGMGAYNQVAGQLGGPTLSAQNYAGYANTLGQQSTGEQRYAQTAGQYDTNALQQAAGGLNAKLDASTNLQNNLGQIADAYSAPSASQSYFNSTADKYGSNKLSDAYSDLNAQYAAPTSLQQNASTIAGNYAAPSASQSTYQSQSGQLGQAGGLEQFAASDLAGTNPYYAQLQAQQSADIDASFNARGGYNSGAAMKAQALGASNLRAQQYQQEGQLQGAAQQAQMSRLGQNQSAASSSDQARLAGLAGQTGVLSTADAQRLAATQGQATLAGQASATDLGYLQGGQQAAGASDQARLAGLSGLTSALSTADAQRLAATQSQIGLAENQASTNLGYLQGGQQAANSAGAANLARTQASIGLTQNTDATNLAQNLGYVGAANSAGAGQVSQYSAYGNMAQGQDAASQAQLMNYMSSAAAAQNASQQRQQQGYTDAAGLGALQAGNTITQYGKAGDNYASMVSAGMGAQLNAAQLAAQQQQNSSANNLALGNLLINGYKAYATGGSSLVPGASGTTTGANGAPILD